MSQPSKKQILLLRVVNAVLFAAVAIVNGLSSAGVGFFTPQGDISDKYTSWLTPAGFAFTIWGLIYLFLAVFTVYQCLPFTLQDPRINHDVSYFLAGNLVLNVVWIFAWNAEWLVVSAIVLASMSAVLYPAYKRVTKRNWQDRQVRVWDILCVEIPISLYLGWIIAATFANLFAIGTLATDEFLNQAIAGVVVVVGLESIAAIHGRNFFPSLVGAWALFAIGSKWPDTPLFSGVCFVAAGLLVLESTLILIWRLVLFSRAKRQHTALHA